MTKFYKTKQFKDLQNEWYDKLYKETDFKDIEYYSFKHGTGQNQPIFDKKYSYFITTKLKHVKVEDLRTYILAAYQHYNALRNFLSHGELHSSLDRKLLELYADGQTYRQITDYLSTFICRYPATTRGSKVIKHYSLFWTFERLKELKRLAFIWNETNENGISTEYIENQAIY